MFFLGLLVIAGARALRRAPPTPGSLHGFRELDGVGEAGQVDPSPLVFARAHIVTGGYIFSARVTLFWNISAHFSSVYPLHGITTRTVRPNLSFHSIS